MCAGEEPHALVSVIDYNLAGMLRDGWVSSQVNKLLDHCRRPAVARVSSRPEDGFRQIDPPQARKMLEAALATTDGAEDPPVSESFAARHAFIRARIRALPPAASRGSRPKRLYWSPERRALLAAEFELVGRVDLRAGRRGGEVASGLAGRPDLENGGERD